MQDNLQNSYVASPCGFKVAPDACAALSAWFSPLPIEISIDGQEAADGSVCAHLPSLAGHACG